MSTPLFPFGSGGGGGVGVQIDPDLEYLIVWDGHARAEFGDWDGDQVAPALEFMAGLLGIRYPEVAVCGLSCRLCPHYHTAGASRCTGCKGESRMSAGCAFLTCAVKRRGIESCGDCGDKSSCERWASHRAAGREHDSFVTYPGARGQHRLNRGPRHTRRSTPINAFGRTSSARCSLSSTRAAPRPTTP